MNAKNIITPIVVIYLVAMVVFWFKGNSSMGWNLFYYSLEKVFAMAAFSLLALETKNRYVMQIALYAAAVCAFMLILFIFSMFFGHDSRFAVGYFLLYSIIAIFTIKKI